MSLVSIWGWHVIIDRIAQKYNKLWPDVYEMDAVLFLNKVQFMQDDARLSKK